MNRAVVSNFDSEPEQLAHGLGHQARLQADVRVAHLPLDLGPGHQRRHRVDHDDVEGRGAHQHVGDLERLLAGVRLGHQQLVDVHAQRRARTWGRARARRR